MSSGDRRTTVWLGRGERSHRKPNSGKGKSWVLFWFFFPIFVRILFGSLRQGKQHYLIYVLKICALKILGFLMEIGLRGH